MSLPHIEVDRHTDGSSPIPYFADEWVRLYQGDCREVLPALDLTVDAVIADPPYESTSLAWDRWPDGWPTVVAEVTRSMWCFGSMRMFLDRRDEFAGWKLSQDVIWQKHTGTGFAADRFRRVHELALHWYRGKWCDVYKSPQREARVGPAVTHPVHRSADCVGHTGPVGSSTWVDDGTRLVQSVIFANGLRGKALHSTEKPAGILAPLIRYACPPGGTVLDPFAGSGSTAVAAMSSGRKAVLIEADERYCETIVSRMAQGTLDLSGGAA